MLEASAGFEPAYTDLQATTIPIEIKGICANGRPDMARTKQESANRYAATPRATLNQEPDT